MTTLSICIALAAMGMPGVDDALAALRNQGKAWFDNGLQLDRAVDAFAAVVERAPDNARDRLHLAMALIRNGEFERALEQLERARALDADEPAILYVRGICHKRLGNFTAGLADLNAVLAGDPDCVPALYAAALCHDGIGAASQALALYERVVALDPHHLSGYYRLFGHYRKLGEAAKAQAAVERFQALRAELPSDLRTEDALERSIYTEILLPPSGAGAPARDVVFGDETAARLPAAATASATPIWLRADDDAFPDLYLPRRGANLLLLNTGDGRFVAAPDSGAAGDGAARCAVAGDYDNDGDHDIFVGNAGRDALLRNDGDGRWTDVTAVSGLDTDSDTRAAAWLDADLDSDLDLVVERHGAPPRLILWRNNGTVDAATPATFAPMEPNGPGYLLLAGVRPASVDSHAVPRTLDADATTRAVIGDLDNDGRMDALVTCGGRVFDPRGATLDIDGVTDLLLEDFDNNGDLDLLALADRLRIWQLTPGGGRHAQAAPALPDGFAPLRHASACDFDDDGRLDLAACDHDGNVYLLRNETADAYPRLALELEGTRSNRDAVGARIETRAGAFGRAAIVRGPFPGVGVGNRKRLDSLAVVWPSGIAQHEMDVETVAARRLRMVETPVVAGSCPSLYVWDGARYVYESDLMGSCALGIGVGDNQYALFDPVEYYKLEHVALPDNAELWRMRICEETREIVYLDAVQLVVADHPTELEAVAELCFSYPPVTRDGIVYMRGLAPPLRAVDSAGDDVAARVAVRDGRWPDGARWLPSSQFHGITEPYRVELEFAPRVDGEELYLTAHGWSAWPPETIWVALAQVPGFALAPPQLGHFDGAAWQTLPGQFAFPALSPKRIARALPHSDGGTLRLRLETNVATRWDELRVGARVYHAAITETTLSANAVLTWHGLGRQRSLDRREPLARSHDQRYDPAPWDPAPGVYTRYGDVTALLAAADDRLVVMGPGDRLDLAFDARALPPLSAGAVRSVFLHTTGWTKETDPHTGGSGHTDPVPFHAMRRYPYAADEARPFEPAYEEYVEAYQQRLVLPATGVARAR